MPNGVTHKELNEALENQTIRLVGKMNRVEDNIKGDIKDVKADCLDDVDKVETRVAVLESDAKKQTIIATIISSATATVVGLLSGVYGGR